MKKWWMVLVAAVLLAGTSGVAGAALLDGTDVITQEAGTLANPSDLYWLENVAQSGVVTTYADALAYAAGLSVLNFGGYNTWRLPSYQELERLAANLIPGQGAPFDNIPSYAFGFPALNKVFYVSDTDAYGFKFTGPTSPMGYTLTGYGSDSDFTNAYVWAVATAPVPEPATMLLLGAGMIGLAGARRRLKR